jgi:murein DD-endopeptidase MepM/ murein hydrolase activator NlpD
MNVLLAIGERLGRLARRPQAYLAAAIPVAIPLVVAAVGSGEPVTPTTLRGGHVVAAAVAPALRYTDLAATSADALPQHSIMLTIEEDDILDSVLVSGGLSRAEAALLTREFGRTIDLHRLRPGNVLRFHRDSTGVVDSVEMKVTGWGQLDATRIGNGFDVSSRPAKQHEIESVVSADIDHSLYEALRSSGEGPQLVQQIVDVFQWDIDFFALQKGDSFSLVVKKRYSGSDLAGYGPILAARFTHSGQTFEAFRHETADGRAGYYARAGRPLRKQFLRAPLQFTRITSGFSKSRFHPLLHCFRPHHGVDYGAPVGTPVMTTADGVVIEARYRRGEGKFVRIRHTSRLETSYLHLSRFAKGIRQGAKVQQGAVIGYVGATGLATGPHLDYRISDGGTWLDPLKFKSLTPDPLRGESLTHFRNNVAALAPKLATPAQQLAEYAVKKRALF